MTIVADQEISTGLGRASRTARLRTAYWQRRHHRARVRRPVACSGDSSLTGHALDLCRLLEASEPQIAPDELIMGSALAVPEDPSTLDLGYYNSHHPPGHAMAGTGQPARPRVSHPDRAGVGFFGGVRRPAREPAGPRAGAHRAPGVSAGGRSPTDDLATTTQ